MHPVFGVISQVKQVKAHPWHVQCALPKGMLQQYEADRKSVV